MSSTRRNVLAALLASPALAMIGSNRTAAQPALGLDLTPDCHDADDHTVAQTEGPYFKPNAPLKQNLVVDAPRGPFQRYKNDSSVACEDQGFSWSATLAMPALAQASSC